MVVRGAAGAATGVFRHDPLVGRKRSLVAAVAPAGENAMMQEHDNGPDPTAILFGSAVSALTLGLGYASFGIVTTMVFAAGFVSGLFLWLALPTKASWQDIKVPFWLALFLFAVHRVEENISGFFKKLSEITAEQTPSLTSSTLILLVLISVGCWLSIPFLMAKRYSIGSYFAWTFFASMGFTELAHILVFPFFDSDLKLYFPGMASVFLLAPVAWWGMWRLSKGQPAPQ